MEVSSDSRNGQANVVALGSISSSAGDTYYPYSAFEPDFHWIRAGICQLIQLVSNHFDEFYDKTIKKRILWKTIAEEMKLADFNCTADDCDKKWRNLKKTYINVLQKQVKGDFTSRFAYFDQMHAFMGKELDPLGMRDQGYNRAVRERTVTPKIDFQRIPYYEVIEDDNFEWSESAVHLLLDLILEHKELFKMNNSDVDRVWDSVAAKMASEGYTVLPEQCQRKWVNLSEGFRHHQGEAEASGINPKWPFFSRVRHVISTVNVPVTIAHADKPSIETLKGSFTTPATLKEYPRRRKRRRPFLKVKDSDSDEDFDDPTEGGSSSSSAVGSALKDLHRCLNVNGRLSHLESRLEVAQKQKAAAKHANTLLSLILSELKRINKSFEEKKREEERQRQFNLVEDDDDEVDVDQQHGILYNHCADTIIPESLLTMDNMAELQLIAKPKLEPLDSDDNDQGIIMVQGL